MNHCCCKPRPLPPPPKPAKPCNCPPRVYRNPPDVIVAAGDNVTVEETQGDAQTTYTVSAQVPEQKPVKVDPELMYGDGVETPLGVYEYDGETAGLVPDAPAEPENKFLRADGTWQIVEAPEQSQSDWAQETVTAPDFIKNKPGTFQGATGSTDGTSGFVPAPQVADSGKFLCGNGSWSDVDNTRECTVAEMNDWLDEVDQEANNG